MPIKILLITGTPTATTSSTHPQSPLQQPSKFHPTYLLSFLNTTNNAGASLLQYSTDNKSITGTKHNYSSSNASTITSATFSTTTTATAFKISSHISLILSKNNQQNKVFIYYLPLRYGADNQISYRALDETYYPDKPKSPHQVQICFLTKAR